MHEAVREYVAAHLPDDYARVLEFGSLDINGGVRDLLDPEASYTGIDAQEGKGVDVVADVTTLRPLRTVDLVLCCEVLEHTPEWREIVASAARHLRDGGTFLVTCATEGRAAHSAHAAGGSLRDGEFYANVAQRDLDKELEKHFSRFESEVVGTDLRAWAVR